MLKIILIAVVVIIFVALVVWGIRMGMDNRGETPALEDPVPGIGDAQEAQEPAGERVTTPEGLVYQDLSFGEGETATEGDIVTVHYVGRLEDGTVFDASVTRNEPFSFRLGSGDVIQGWDIGVAGMKIGGVRELVIPAELAYGSQERGPIPPNSTLIFQVQLLDVQRGN